jgi:hypothetical protein
MVNSRRLQLFGETQCGGKSKPSWRQVDAPFRGMGLSYRDHEVACQKGPAWLLGFGWFSGRASLIGGLRRKEGTEKVHKG